GAPALLLHYLRGVTRTPGAVEPTDGELVRRFADRHDEAAFAALLSRHGGMVLGVCRRILRNEQDAEDAFQAVFLVTSREAAALRRKGAVGPGLFGVARRLALRAGQQGRRRQTHEACAGENSCARAARSRPDNPVNELTVREAQEILDEELACLPER